MSKKLAKSFIQAAQKRLESEREKSLEQITTLKEGDPFMDPDHASDNAAVDTDVREQLGHETVAAEIRDLERRVRDIDLALSKIKKDDYGYCERCRQAIPIPRLELVPEAKYCIDCERQLVK